MELEPATMIPPVKGNYARRRKRWITSSDVCDSSDAAELVVDGSAPAPEPFAIASSTESNVSNIVASRDTTSRS
jgi:hypothetical protein